jgi:lysozyme family protein
MDRLDLALDYVLENEGGWSNNALDSGGKTMYGITHGTLFDWNQRHPEKGFPASVADLTKDQAKEIYRTEYWKWDFIKDDAIAIKAMDMAVNCGVVAAVKILQRAVRVQDDGKIGPKTIEAVNAADPGKLMKAIILFLTSYYQGICSHNPSQLVFLKGWLKRAEKVPNVG